MVNLSYAPKKKRSWRPGGVPKKIRRFKEDTIRDIRAEFSSGQATLGLLARKHLTTLSHISKIIKRKIYKDVF